MPKHKPKGRGRLERVSIRAERHDQPDWDRFAWAVLQHARIVAARKQRSNKTVEGKPKP
jgi:hypothetical protein